MGEARRVPQQPPSSALPVGVEAQDPSTRNLVLLDPSRRHLHLGSRCRPPPPSCRPLLRLASPLAEDGRALERAAVTSSPHRHDLATRRLA
ncbi:hypothetical protein E2562_028676 [Oryza meyeriana var. granulata]|uniref:Uncharacterized protein n=1 Tax=Oryza meyeriana var. granulata TaxID=110450 RepID=A0A6G1BMK1_9ORYZ|nr:hypothetical protein E2562_028676 [Oryza meyeriana var. granulata]